MIKMMVKIPVFGSFRALNLVNSVKNEGDENGTLKLYHISIV